MKFLNNFGRVANAAFDSFTNDTEYILKKAANGVSNGITNGVNGVSKVYKNGVNGVKNGVTNGVNGIVKNISNETEYTFNNKTDPIGKRPKEALLNTIGKAANGLSEEYPVISGTLSGAYNAASPLVESLADQAEFEAESGDISPMASIGHALRIIRGNGNAGAHLANRLGVDQDIGRFAGEGIAESVLTAGVGKGSKALKNSRPLSIGGPKPSLANATAGSNGLSITSPKPTDLSPQVMDLTIKNPDRIAADIKQGSAKSDRWKDGMREWSSRRAQLKEQLETAAREGKSTGHILETAYNDNSTGPTRLTDNPVAYKVDKFKEQSVINPLTTKGNKKWQQQHHLFPKQESYQFIERMAKLGDDDDVLNMFLYAEEMDAVMGGRLYNMLNMEDLPHSVLHSSRSRKIDGRQLQAIEMKNLVDNAKSTDELMDMFHDYITNNIQVSKNQAHALNKMGKRLNKHGRWNSLNILREKNFMGKNPKN